MKSIENLYLNNKISGVSGLYSISGDFGVYDGLEANLKMKDKNIVQSEFKEFDIKCEFNFGEVCQRKDTFTNKSDRTLTLNRYISRFAFDGADCEVYVQSNGWQNESKGMWQPLISMVGAKNRGIRTCEGAVPFVAIWDKQTRKGIVFHLIPNAQWKINVTKEVVYEEKEYTVIDMGMTDSGLNLEIAPNEIINMPEILFYTFENKTDMDCYKLHSYYNQKFPRKALPVMYNSWLLNFNRIDIEQIKKQISVAADLGIEYFTVDAGWFGNSEEWYEQVGFWEENLNNAFCGRLRETSDFIKSKGMKFGLWMEPERARSNAPVLKTHPEYFLEADEGNFILDFSNKNARDYITNITINLIEKYNIDMFKFDFNCGVSMDEHRSVFYFYYQGFFEYITKIKEKYPNIYLENCASGGQRMELMQMKYFDSYWITDNVSPYDELRIYKDTLLRMPPQAMEKWVALKCTEGFTPTYKERIHHRLLSCNDAMWESIVSINRDYLFAFLSGGSFGFSCDIADFSRELKEEIKIFIEKYKAERKFWTNCVSRILIDNDEILAIQYCDVQKREIKVFVFCNKIHKSRVRIPPVINMNFDYLINGNNLLSKDMIVEGIYVDVQGNYKSNYFELIATVED